METPSVRRRFAGRKTWLRIVLAATAVALLWSAAWFYVPPIVAAQAEGAAERALGRRLSLGRVTFQPWTLELTVADLAVAGPTADAPPALEVKRVFADVALTSLFRLAPVVDRLEIDAPVLRVARTAEGHYDVDDVLQRLASAPAPPEPPRFALHNIVVRDGAIDFADRPLATTHRVRGLTLGVPFVSSLPSEREIKVEPRLAFTLDGSRFDTAGTTTPFAERGNGELRLKLDGFAVTPWLGYLPRDLPATLRAATFDADLVIAFERRPKLSLNVAGTVAAKGVEVVDRAAGELLQVQSLRVRVDELRPLERLARLASVEIDAPRVVAARNAAGRVNLLLAAEGPGGPAPVARVPLPTSARAGAGASAAAPARASAPAATAAASAPGAAAAAPPWRLSLAALALRAGRLDWRDATTAPPAALSLADVSLDAKAIGWPLAAPVLFRGEATIGSGDRRGKLSFSGQGDTRSAKVTVALGTLPLAPLAPYLRTVLAAPLVGDASADFDLDWRAGDGPLSLRVAARRLAIAGLVLGDGKAPDAAAELVEAGDAQIDTVARSASIGRLALRAPRVRIAREAGRPWSFERLAVAPRDAAVPTPGAAASASGAGAAWRLALGELAVERGRVSFADRTRATPVALDVIDLGATVRGFALDSAKPAPFHVAARVSVPAGPSGKAVGSGLVGSVDARGELGGFAAGAPSSLRAALLLKDLPLHLLDPYLDDLVDLEVQKAQGSFKGELRWSHATAGDTVGVRGDAAVDDVRVVSAATDRKAPRRSLAMVSDGTAGRQLLNWKSLSLRGIELALAPGKAPRVRVAETALSDFFARIVLDESGRLNLEDVARPASAASGPAASVPVAAASAPVARAAPVASSAAPVGPSTAVVRSTPSASPAPIIAFGPIAVVGGRIQYQDRFVRPNYTANLSELSGRLESFSSEPTAAGLVPQLAELSLRGRVEGTASLEITGKVNPLAKPLALDLKAKVRDLELPPLSPYAIKYAGYGIERGKMSVDLAYVVQPNGQLTASNKIVLNQLAFGDKVEGSTASLPVKLAVALLADRNGVIDLDLPVSGSINDPQFSLGGVIWKIVTNLVVKAVTAPFALLASAFGGADGELSRVEFAAGKATLDPGARTSLDKIAKALADRPAVKLTIVGESRLDRERDAWKKERLQQIVRAEKRRQAIAGGIAAQAEVTVADAEVPALLKEVYKRADIVKPKNVLGLAKDLPPAEMEALLLANMTVADDAMQQLAVRRGVAVRDYLASQSIPAERLFLGAPKTASEDADWTPRADLKLAAS